MNSFPPWAPRWLPGLFNRRVYWLLQTDYCLGHIFQKQKVAHNRTDAGACLADTFLKWLRPLTLMGWQCALAAAPQCPIAAHPPHLCMQTVITTCTVTANQQWDFFLPLAWTSGLCFWKTAHLCLTLHFYLTGRETATSASKWRYNFWSHNFWYFLFPLPMFYMAKGHRRDAAAKVGGLINKAQLLQR